MILDGHIHMRKSDTLPGPMLERMARAGVDGGIIISPMPENMDREAAPFEQRLEQLLRFCRDEPLLFPFLFLNPAGENALEQIDRGVREGVAGFKIICNQFYPSDPRCMEVYRHIAAWGKPVLFHSGILWDGRNPSGSYNRPVEFEALLQVEGLRFSLAHLSWPWCDECIAVYGKFRQGANDDPKEGSRMFLDNTPGTPKIYRREVLAKLFGVGYGVGESVIFGSDNCAGDYNDAWVKDWIGTDMEIYRELGLSKEETDRIFSENLLSFLKGDKEGGNR